MLAVGLVGVLVAVALPSYNSYRDKVRVKVAAQDIAIISLAIRAYRLDVGSHPSALADVGMNSMLDPWGRAYVYYNVESEGRGGARKDRALNPINTDFDLYSVGPDGATRSQITLKDSVDDVIRGRNGAFVGVAAEF